MDGLSFGVVDQPILVVLVHPGAGRNLKWGSPNAKDQAIRSDMVSDNAHALGKLSGIRRFIFAAGVLVAFINLEEVIAESLQV